MFVCVCRGGKLPKRGGQKDFEPDGSEEQARKLAQSTLQWTVVMQQEHVQQRKNLSVAVWVDEDNEAEVSQMCVQ